MFDINAPQIVNAAIDTTCKELSQIDGKESLITKLKKVTYNVEVVYTNSFFDIPYQSLPIVKGDEFSDKYILEAKISTISLKKLKIMYLDTIHGPWLAFDLISEMVANDVSRSIRTSGNYESLGGGLYRYKNTDNFLRFEYFENLDKYYAFVCNRVELFEHPWYSNNFIVEHMQ